MRLLTKWALLCVLLTSSLQADQRFIVQILGGQVTLSGSCLLLGCSVVRGLEDPAGQLFLVSIPNLLNANLFVNLLSLVSGVLDIEPDRPVSLTQSSPPVPAALYDTQPTVYFGTTVRHGYVFQPAAQIVRIQESQAAFGVAGTGTVAVIDTGVDPNHPALQSVLVPGYDFTRNEVGFGSELSDVGQSTAAVVDGSPVYVNSTTAAAVDQSTAAVVDNPQYAAFGHGTMVAGVIHLVAPQALIMSLKAFGANGSGNTSDIVRAIFRAAGNHARVINMSFSMPVQSIAMRLAVDYATSTGAVCVASAGNQGQHILAYPAAFPNVIGVASTTNDDIRSTFSNYGSNLVWLAAPGEGIVTTYPYGAYAAAWGTSFSAPFVSGTAALLLGLNFGLNESAIAADLAQAKPINPDLGHGRLDIFLAMQAATH